jgi:hypothetical protein
MKMIKIVIAVLALTSMALAFDINGVTSSIDKTKISESVDQEKA